MTDQQTIVAQATATGKAGVGIIRVSGNQVTEVAQQILGKLPTPRYADYCHFNDDQGRIIDQGIALYFKAPHSFTGEDVLELHGHGGPVVLDMLIQAILRLDQVRLAQPGEFSERAFLNDKLDLTQAEAIADLIESHSEQAARSAMQSLQGQFSTQINQLVEEVIQLRLYVEAAIDFPEEEIDFLNDGRVAQDLAAILITVEDILKQATQGAILREGMRVVIAGKPNAGKSSLLNALAGKDSAIVTKIAGTTRDVLTEQINIDGMPLHIIDTAGLRDHADLVEKIGIERAWKTIKQADRLLLVVDASQTQAAETVWQEFIEQLPEHIPITLIRNKADLTRETLGESQQACYPLITLSAKTNQGIDALKRHLKQCIGYQDQAEGCFMARRRHIKALKQAQDYLYSGQEQLTTHAAGELLAEDLRCAQQHLNEITGEFSSDDLLGKIFSSFCIGK